MTAVASSPPAAPAPAGKTSAPPPRPLASLGDLAYLIYPLVPTRWLFALARLRGRAQYRRGGPVCEAVRANIADILGAGAGAGEAERHTREFFENQQLQNLLVMLAPRMSDETLARVMPIEGLDRLDRAYAQKKGVVFLGSHLNSVMLFVAVVLLRRKGYDIRIAMPTMKDPWLQTQVRMLADRLAGRGSLREQLGAFFAQFNIRPIVERFAQNTAVGMTGDGWHSASFVEVEFMGRRVPFTTGAMGMARSTGAVIVPAFMVGRPPFGVRMLIEEPFTVPKTGQPKHDVQERVQRYAGLLEKHIRADLAGWQHLTVPHLFETMTTWTQRSLSDRYVL
jgi:lauroyl/myristoyl acyltransferase